MVTNLHSHLVGNWYTVKGIVLFLDWLFQSVYQFGGDKLKRVKTSILSWLQSFFIKFETNWGLWSFIIFWRIPVFLNTCSYRLLGIYFDIMFIIIEIYQAIFKNLLITTIIPLYLLEIGKNLTRSRLIIFYGWWELSLGCSGFYLLY